MLQGKTDEAFGMAELAVETAKQRGDAQNIWAAGAWRTLGTIQLMQGMPAASQSLERALECDSSDAWAYALRSLYYLDRTPRADLQKALNDAVIANEVATVADSRIKYVFALASLKNGEFDNAAVQANECIRLNGQSSPCRLILAVANAQRSLPGEARQSFDAALTILKSEASMANPSVNARRGVLWFQNTEQLRELCVYAAESIGGSCEF